MQSMHKRCNTGDNSIFSYKITNNVIYSLRGQGVLDLGMGKIEFDAVFDRGQCKLPDAFYGIK